jgi:type VI secretion system secreted protein Hcp
MSHEDFFLKLETERGGVVKGESQDGEHKDEIDVIGWSWSMSAPTSAAGVRHGRASPHPLVVRKRMDLSSPALMGAVSRNDRITTAVLTARRAGDTGGQETFLVITLRDAFITAFEVEAEGGDQSSGAVERLKIAFHQITVDYTLQGEDGLQRGATSFDDTWAASD